MYYVVDQAEERTREQLELGGQKFRQLHEICPFLRRGTESPDLSALPAMMVLSLSAGYQERCESGRLTLLLTLRSVGQSANND